MLGRPPATPAPDLSLRCPGRDPQPAPGRLLGPRRQEASGSAHQGSFQLQQREERLSFHRHCCPRAAPQALRWAGHVVQGRQPRVHIVTARCSECPEHGPGIKGLGVRGGSGLGLKEEAEILCRGWVGRTRWSV